MILNKQTGEAKLSLDLDGGQALSWEILKDSEYKKILYQGSQKKRTGIPILFPFADPLEGDILNISNTKMPQHGFARHQTFQLVDEFDNGVLISLTNEDLDPIWRQAYPFEFDFRLKISLVGHSLEYELSCQSKSTKPIPIAPGLHPYFTINHSGKKNFKLTNFDAGKIDWNNFIESKFSDFTGESRAIFPSYTILVKSLEDIPRHLVVWTQNSDQDDSDFICVEPFYRATNGINTDPILILPGDTWRSKIVFEAEF